jgi:uncharacterized membrane protein
MKLIAITFDTFHGADEALLKLRKLEKAHVVELDDVVVVERPEKGKPKIRQSKDLVAAGALSGGAWGGLWGLLLGLLFLNPLFGWAAGLALGAGAGALGGKLTDIGVDDDFVREVAADLKPGTSALFLLIRQATEDKFLEALRGVGGRLLQTSLSYEEEAQLQAVLSGEDPEAARPEAAGHEA